MIRLNLPILLNRKKFALDKKNIPTLSHFYVQGEVLSQEKFKGLINIKNN